MWRMMFNNDSKIQSMFKYNLDNLQYNNNILDYDNRYDNQTIQFLNLAMNNNLELITNKENVTITNLKQNMFNPILYTQQNYKIQFILNKKEDQYDL